MRLSGYIRAEIKRGDDILPTRAKKDRDGYAWRTLAELHLQTATDTETGQLPHIYQGTQPVE